jgi:hypothetical protein
MKVKYSKKCKLLIADTDSLTYHVQTDDGFIKIWKM